MTMSCFIVLSTWKGLSLSCLVFCYILLLFWSTFKLIEKLQKIIQRIPMYVSARFAQCYIYVWINVRVFSRTIWEYIADVMPLPLNTWVCLLKTRTLSYITTVQWSSSRNVTWLQFCCLKYSSYSDFTDCPSDDYSNFPPTTPIWYPVRGRALLLVIHLFSLL